MYFFLKNTRKNSIIFKINYNKGDALLFRIKVLRMSFLFIHPLLIAGKDTG